ncbi:beta-propeller domain-containing protein [Glycomyces sp. NPDC046736]|uniref:beta-propeller domain-containing protein n=1 Tax=Glycomyces sp. NPDC046736 TaxID=3155615 RepID=UPI0033E99FB0
MKPRLLIALAAVLAASACTSSAENNDSSPPVPWVPASAQLAAYESCDDALKGIQDAAVAATEGWDQSNAYGREEAATGDQAAPLGADSAGASSAEADPGSFSETNNAVAGVDEPDLVKTDGVFVYAVAGTALRVVDTRSGEVVAERPFDESQWGHQLFLGDDELLLMYSEYHELGGEHLTQYSDEFRIERLDPTTLEVLDAFAMDGSMVDARLVEGEVRLAVSTQPRIDEVWDVMWRQDATEEDVAEALRETEIEDWLPSYSVNGEDAVVDCGEVAHPERFSGSSVTVFALPADGAWESVEPHTVMADGDTVHGTVDSLYVAHFDYSWAPEEPQSETEIYRFHFEDGSPRLAGEAAVPGSLLNQYSLSEYDGHLRVASTESPNWGWACPANASCVWGGDFAEEAAPSKSTVTVFAVGAGELTETGSVTDLGVGEQIYAVRFMGPVGYVVTFRQTDPLYTVDLSDPAEPVVTGELKITGYSAYLHPVAPGRLLGVGQEATEEGRATGLQVSLFDTGAAEATVLDQYFRADAYSPIEYDPHAFLYWAEESVAVMPYTQWNSDYTYETGAVVLAVGDDSLAEEAAISHAGNASGAQDYQLEITRALVIDGQLWTVSNSGLQANALGDYAQTAWVAW